jgi:hypothetical protein
MSFQTFGSPYGYPTDGSFELPEGGVCFAGVAPNPVNADLLNGRIAAENAAWQAQQELAALKAKQAAAEKAAADKVATEKAAAAEKLQERITALKAARDKGVKPFPTYVLAKTRHSVFHRALKFLVKKGVLTLTKDEQSLLGSCFPWLGIGRWNPMNWCFPNEKTGKVGDTDVDDCGSQVGLDEAHLRAFCGLADLAAFPSLEQFDARQLRLVAYQSRAVAAAWARLVDDGVSDALDMAHQWVRLAAACDEQLKQLEFPKPEASKPKVNKPKAEEPKAKKPNAKKPKAVVASPTKPDPSTLSVKEKVDLFQSASSEGSAQEALANSA